MLYLADQGRLRMTMPVMEPERGAVSIPAADGYHYADDHPWSDEDQAALTDGLWDTLNHFRNSKEAAPVFDALSFED
jgi:hypothetical protein